MTEGRTLKQALAHAERLRKGDAGPVNEPWNVDLILLADEVARSVKPVGQAFEDGHLGGVLTGHAEGFSEGYVAGIEDAAKAICFYCREGTPLRHLDAGKVWVHEWPSGDWTICIAERARALNELIERIKPFQDTNTSASTGAA